MPSKSAAQARLMRAVAHGWHKPGGGGPSEAVAKEFVAADKHSMARGGSVKKHKKSGGINPAMLAAMAGPAGGQGGPMAPGPGAPPGMGMKKGGSVAKGAKKQLSATIKENKGGESKIGGGIEKRGSTSTSLIGMRGAGIASKGKTSTKRFASGGSVRGHGIESSGRTRGRFI